MDDIVSSDDSPRKQCKKCFNFYPATHAYFHKSRNYKDGFKAECKKCRGRGRNFGYTPKECKEGEKECLGCHEIWPATEEYFNKSPRNKMGLRTRCKRCQGQGTTFGKQSWVKEHRDNEKWCPRCKQWLPKNLNYFNIANGRKDGFYPHCKECGVKDRIARHEAIDRQQKAYYRNNREKRHANARNRKSNSHNVFGMHTAQEVQEQFKRQKGRCYYAACGFAKFEKKNGKYAFHVEHTFPLTRVAGTDIPANSMSYLVLACPACNLGKYNRFPWEWPQGGRLL